MPTNLPRRKPQYEEGMLPAVLLAAGVIVLAVVWAGYTTKPEEAALSAPPPVTETR